MYRIYFQSFLLILFLLHGCTFEPDGEKFIEVDSTGKLSNIEVDLNLASDTIYIQKNGNGSLFHILRMEIR